MFKTLREWLAESEHEKNKGGMARFAQMICVSEAWLSIMLNPEQKKQPSYRVARTIAEKTSGQVPLSWAFYPWCAKKEDLPEEAIKALALEIAVAREQEDAKTASYWDMEIAGNSQGEDEDRSTSFSWEIPVEEEEEK